MKMMGNPHYFAPDEPKDWVSRALPEAMTYSEQEGQIITPEMLYHLLGLDVQGKMHGDMMQQFMFPFAKEESP